MLLHNILATVYHKKFELPLYDVINYGVRTRSGAGQGGHVHSVIASRQARHGLWMSRKCDVYTHLYDHMLLGLTLSLTFVCTLVRHSEGDKCYRF